MRNARLMLALLPVAAVVLTACSTQPAASPIPTSSTSASSPPASTTTPAPTTTTTPVVVASTTKPKPAAPACQPQSLRASPADKTTSGKTVSVTTAVKNVGASTCTIQGYPQVAITALPPATGNWPRKQLTVTKDGPSYPVTLVPGDGSFVTLTFNQCQAGQKPLEGPILLMGVPDGGIEVTLADGSDFVECGDVVKTIAFQEHLP